MTTSGDMPAMGRLPPPEGPLPSGSEAATRVELTGLEHLVVLATLTTESDDEAEIVRLAADRVPVIGHVVLCGVHVTDRGWLAVGGPCSDPRHRSDVEAQLAVLGSPGGPVAVPGQDWSWAFPLQSLEGALGFLAVGAAAEPPTERLSLLQALARQVGGALASARLLAHERAVTAELRATNEALTDAVSALEHNVLVDERLDRVAVAGEGPLGVARAVHQLTGLAVAVEDRHGNLQGWAGSDRPDEPYPKDPTGRRQAELDRAHRERRPVRFGGRLVAAAGRGDDIAGALVLFDPEGRSGVGEEVVLAHAATVLSIEMSRQRDVAETEMRLGRDLVEDLLTGVDDEGAYSRARALGYDLARPHHVVAVRATNGSEPQPFFDAVRRAARDTGVGTLLADRDGAVVVLADTELATWVEAPWEGLRGAIVDEPGGGACLVGVGGMCELPRDFARSYRQARLALEMQAVAGAPDRAIVFDGLGVYRIFAEAGQPASVEPFVQDWLGPPLDHDSSHGTGLVATLTQYLEHGGNYDATAHDLGIHRSTLKARLHRIRAVGGLDLADPDTTFNLQLATRAWRTLAALRKA